MNRVGSTYNVSDVEFIVTMIWTICGFYERKFRIVMQVLSLLFHLLQRDIISILIIDRSGFFSISTCRHMRFISRHVWKFCHFNTGDSIVPRYALVWDAQSACIIWA